MTKRSPPSHHFLIFKFGVRRKVSSTGTHSNFMEVFVINSIDWETIDAYTLSIDTTDGSVKGDGVNGDAATMKLTTNQPIKQ